MLVNTTQIVALTVSVSFVVRHFLVCCLLLFVVFVVVVAAADSFIVFAP